MTSRCVQLSARAISKSFQHGPPPPPPLFLRPTDCATTRVHTTVFVVDSYRVRGDLSAPWWGGEWRRGGEWRDDRETRRAVPRIVSCVRIVADRYSGGLALGAPSAGGGELGITQITWNRARAVSPPTRRRHCRPLRVIYIPAPISPSPRPERRRVGRRAGVGLADQPARNNIINHYATSLSRS